VTVQPGVPNFITVGDGNHTLDAVQGPLTITGGAGSVNLLTVDDSGTSQGRTYNITGNTIDRSGAALVTYNSINSLTLNGGSGGNTFNVQSLSSDLTLALNGGSGTNTLQGPNSDTTWQITGSNAGSFTGGVSFTAMQNLIGGAGADTFVFADGASVSGTIDGGGGTNTLDYSAYASSNVLVNLQTGFATGVGGGIANIQNAKGATGGPAGSYNILVGNGGNVLTGGNDRRNLLIAGPTASTLIGGNGDDILIGGTTTYDAEPGMVSLQAIMAYWAGSADDYATRVSNLLNGNGVPILAPFDPTTGMGVIGNGGGNTLTGNAGLDLFYGNLALDTYDWDPATETFVSV
jgi:Ca2+-binding RTX toxin-like protein